jgi:Lrp/AsnC family leucine-responsive transcriptional regulator
MPNAKDVKIDDGDLRILRILQEDGRITNQDLARRCGMSTATCFERTRRLRNAGVIRGFTALLDPACLGRELLVFIEVILDRTTDDAFSAFAEHIQAVPDVLECHMVAGGFDYLLKVRVPDMAAYREFLGQVLASMPSVRETRTYAVIEEVKQTTQLPI